MRTVCCQHARPTRSPTKINDHCHTRVIQYLQRIVKMIRVGLQPSCYRTIPKDLDLLVQLTCSLLCSSSTASFILAFHNRHVSQDVPCLYLLRVNVSRYLAMLIIELAPFIACVKSVAVDFVVYIDCFFLHFYVSNNAPLCLVIHY